MSVSSETKPQVNSKPRAKQNRCTHTAFEEPVPHNSEDLFENTCDQGCCISEALELAEYHEER